MELQLVNIETAKLAAQCKFDWPCYCSYEEEPTEGGISVEKVSAIEVTTSFKFTSEDLSNAADNGYWCYLAPEQELLRKWLRDIHKIHVDAAGSIILGYRFVIIRYLGFDKIRTNSTPGVRYKNYEEALEFGLFTALEMLKETINNGN